MVFAHQQQTVSNPEEFRLPIGARKSGMIEPAIRRLGAMDNSGFGRLGNSTERVREAMRLGRRPGTGDNAGCGKEL